MSELPDAERMLEAAEQAAANDDLVSADELLRGAARIQIVNRPLYDPGDDEHREILRRFGRSFVNLANVIPRFKGLR